VNNRVAVAAFAIVALFPAVTMAQHHGHSTAPSSSGHGGHVMPGAKPAANLSEASKAFAAANAKMHKDMGIALTGNADLDFARGMIPHHQGAIDVSEIVLKYGKDAEVQKLAAAIIAAQKTEILQMSTWLTRNAALTASPEAEAIKKAYSAVNTTMHHAMTIPLIGNADADFIKGMIPHHEGAVAMAKVLLQFGKDAELRQLAENVVRTQNEEKKPELNHSGFNTEPASLLRGPHVIPHIDSHI
jgi:uncharacterized protein (DUF305 family)